MTNEICECRHLEERHIEDIGCNLCQCKQFKPKKKCFKCGKSLDPKNSKLKNICRKCYTNPKTKYQYQLSRIKSLKNITHQNHSPTTEQSSEDTESEENPQDIHKVTRASGSGDSLSIFEYEDKDLDMKFYPKDKVKEAVKKNKEVDSQVLDFLEGLKELRINDELPFGTCDYHEIDRLIEEIKNKDKIFGGALV